jgi:hypothetical protein
MYKLHDAASQKTNLGIKCNSPFFIFTKLSIFLLKEHIANIVTAQLPHICG